MPETVSRPLVVSASADGTDHPGQMDAPEDDSSIRIDAAVSHHRAAFLARIFFYDCFVGTVHRQTYLGSMESSAG